MAPSATCFPPPNSPETIGNVQSGSLPIGILESIDIKIAAAANVIPPVDDVKADPPEIMPIAIIGMACRLPGDVSTPGEFWELCARNRNGWSEIPKERFSHKAFSHPNPGKPGCYNPVGGHFLKEDVGLFDAQFFNITAQEAKSLDPQQRLLLECTFEALENAGITKHEIAGKNVGVFIGGSFSDYDLNNFKDTETVPMYQATGCAFSLQSNRISHFFDLRGPSMTIDTACSSSLSALHMACQSLRSGDSSQVIVGGIHLNISPEYWISMSMSRLFSPDGKSFSFDSRANGFGRGEGCGIICLKPLDQALKDNDHIHAILANTGVNQDGRTPGITMPCSKTQETLIRSVYERAGLNPQDTAFIEAHGTGTEVGDPIEATALHSVFGEGRTKRQPLFIGSVKANIGHLEGASGVVSVIKAAMMLEKNFILPNVNFEMGNPKIPFSEWHMKVPSTQMPFPRNKKYISVNNIGFGGTNAHAVLEKAPFVRKPLVKDLLEANDPQSPGHRATKLFVLSGSDKRSLEMRVKQLGIYLEQRPEIFQDDLMGNLAYTLCQRRSFLPWKVAVVAKHSFEIVSTLASGHLVPVRETDKPQLGFVFTGQGAQWYGMGRELFEGYPVFAATINAADCCLTEMGAPFSLLDELKKDESCTKINEAHICQPACTAIQIALVDLLESWKIKPSAVTGHSSGEIAAAYAAKILTMEACMAIAYYRGQSALNLREKFPNLRGSMMAVGCSQNDIQPLLKRVRSGEVGVACINSPSSLTISGDEAGVSELQTLVEEKKWFNRKLHVDIAYHSHHMDLVAEDYYLSLANLKGPKDSEIAFFSSLRGQKVGSCAIEPSYWVDNLTCPVRFSEALQDMCETAKVSNMRLALIEIGPHSALAGPIKQILKSLATNGTKVSYSPTLVRNKDAVATMLELAGSLFTMGVVSDFAAVNFPKPLTRPLLLLTDMARYPWNHETKYWHESRFSDLHKHRDSPRNDILGVLAEYSELEPTWRNIIRIDDLPWLRQHQFQTLTVYPAAGYIVMALEAAAQKAKSKSINFDRFDLRELNISKPLIISDEDIETTIRLSAFSESIKSASDVWDEFRICSWSKERGWIEHCTGMISVKADNWENPVESNREKTITMQALGEDILDIQRACKETVNIPNLYDSLSVLGASYGELFQGITNCKACESHAIADIVLSDTASVMPNNYQPDLIIHPAFLDQLIQMYWPILGTGSNGMKTLYMPSSISHMSISKDITQMVKIPGDKLIAYCSGKESRVNPNPTKMKMFATAPDDSTKALITIDTLTISPVLNSDLSSSSAHRELCYKLQWEPAFEASRIEHDGFMFEFQERLTFKVLDVVILHGEIGFNDAILTVLTEKILEQTGRTPDCGSLGTIDTKGKICIVLQEFDKPLLSTMSEDTFYLLQELLAGVEGILWVVRGAYGDPKSPDLNIVSGLSRTLRSESMLPFATLDMASDSRPSNAANIIMKVFEKVFIVEQKADSDIEMEFMERNGEILKPRIVLDDALNKFVHQETQQCVPEEQPFEQEGRPLKLAISIHGALDTLHFVESRRHPLPDDEIEIEIVASGANFKDVMIAMGQLSSEYLGIECSGIVKGVGKNVAGFSVGDRVAAMTEGAYSTNTRCKATSATIVPEGMSFQEAATIPVVYCTAYYGLIDLGRLCQGERILIHAAAGGVGQAAIMLSQMIGAEIYATVGSVEKKEFIMNQYGIPEDHIFFSRSTAFGKSIRRATQNKGVDVIINSLAGDYLRETWECLGHFGRFIEIGKRDIVSNTRLEMAQFENNATFSSVDLTVVAAERPLLMQRLMKDVFVLLKSAHIKPVAPLTVFSISEVETAFRTLQSGKIHGKIVVVPKSGDEVKVVPAKVPITILKPDATYIIVGGTGGIGRSMTRWMVQKGARNIALLSRSESITTKVQDVIDDVGKLGAKVVVRRCNAALKKDVERVVHTELLDMLPVRGIIHATMVLHDVLFEKMTFEQWNSVVSGKVDGAWNFHNTLSRTHLDFFVTISSAAGIVGNRGQAAYAAANTFLDAFVQHRMHQGLPASAIDLTAVSDTGYLADNRERQAEVMENLGSETINEAEVLALLAAAMTGDMAASCNGHCITGMKMTGQKLPFWANDAKFTHIRQAAIDSAAEDGGAVAEPRIISLNTALKRSNTITNAQKIVCDGLVDKIAMVLMLDKEDMDVSKSIGSYGLDSLVAIEIRNFISREFEANLQVLELLTIVSITALAKIVCEKSKVAGQWKIVVAEAVVV